MLKKTLPYILVLALSVGLFVYSPAGLSPDEDSEPGESLSAEVVAANDAGEFMQELSLELEDGRSLDLMNDESMSASPREFAVGDELVLVRYQAEDGRYSYYISDYVRQPALAWLFVVFVVAVVVVTKWQGLGSLLGMLFSFLVLFKIILPQILGGADPVIAAILGSALIVPATFFLSHGVNRKTGIAVLGTFLTLIVTGLLAVGFAEFANLTGTASEEANFLSMGARSNIDFRGLVLAGMIISILGILDDITISQSSVVQQLKAAKKNIKFKELYFRAITVGKDHIASLVNTLVLVYTGASLPMLLLFLDKSSKFADVVNLEFIAEEIVQMLVGSIGLVLAVPLTTFIACFWASDEKDSHSGCCH